MPKTVALVGIAIALSTAALAAQTAPPPIIRFVEATREDDRIATPALRAIAAGWQDSYAALLIDLARMMRAPRGPAAGALIPEPERSDDAGGDDGGGGRPRAGALPDVADRGSPIRRRLIAFLDRQTRKNFGDDLDRWRAWIWSLPYDPHPEYATLKSIVYGQIDPRMRAFFPPGVRSSIRLDEIDWGGVTVNGIPPLRRPRVVTPSDAKYLKDSNVVFGIVINGEARAYPKRILAWHEMAIDRIGGIDLTIVYCTLCGTVIPYENTVGDRVFRFGTSGLLYQSNKLMFDEDSNSLWSSIEGTPVVGSLVDSGLQLRMRPVVTTTWKEWRAAHPTTTVLSIDTGFTRDYAEGAAYRDYFSHDRLMFQVSKTDRRLANKAEVLTLRAADPKASGVAVPIAIEARFLQGTPVFSFDAAGQRYTVVTSAGGANRVYRVSSTFPEQRASAVIRDSQGRGWTVTEDALVSADDPAVRAPRVAAQRAFWFGWFAQFPDTILIQR